MSSSSEATSAVPVSDEKVDALRLRAVDEFVNSRALEILREWIVDPEIADLLPEAERVVSADAARKKVA